MTNDELRTKVNRMEIQLESLRDSLVTITASIKNVTEEIAEIKEALLGTTEPGKPPGMIARLGTLETSNGTRTKIEGAGILLILSLLAKAVWDLITNTRIGS